MDATVTDPNEKKVNMWKQATAGVTLAFALVSGGLFLANRNLKVQASADQIKIASLMKTPFITNDVTSVHIPGGNIALLTHSVRSLDGKQNVDHTTVFFAAVSKEGVPVNNTASFDASPKN